MLEAEHAVAEGPGECLPVRLGARVKQVLEAAARVRAGAVDEDQQRPFFRGLR